jgi:hypothetical protein
MNWSSNKHGEEIPDPVLPGVAPLGDGEEVVEAAAVEEAAGEEMVPP